MLTTLQSSHLKSRTALAVAKLSTVCKIMYDPTYFEIEPSMMAEKFSMLPDVLLHLPISQAKV